METAHALYRKLSLKSRLGFGRYDTYTVGDLLKIGKAEYLKWVYYNCSQIDFLPEVKEAVGIVEEIAKPGVAPEKFRTMMDAKIEAIREERQRSWEGLTEEEKQMRRYKAAAIRKRINRQISGSRNRDRILSETSRHLTKGQLQAFNQGHV